jgi:uncharacterized membrane protein
MVLMAIDHVRVYSGIPAGGHTPGIFFTRWVTHFCVPAFVFLAGTGAFLQGKKLSDPGRLARFLVTRGFLLVLLEVTLIRLCWTFNLDYGHFFLAGVIWMLGWCMILLAALIRLPVTVIGIIGLAIIFLQQVFSLPTHALPPSWQSGIGRVWEFIYPAGQEPPPGISILYVLVPWIGVMAAGYAFGPILGKEPIVRRKFCLIIGLSATALFLVAGSINLLLHPAPANAPNVLFRLLNQTKYPASQLYLLMTLGPLIALMPFAERAHGWLADVLATFGRVPLFYYLLHIPLIHTTALVVNYLREGNAHGEWYATAPFTWFPEEYHWGLPLLYLVFAIVVVLLYFPCRWFARAKARRRNGWLRYF